MEAGRSREEIICADAILYLMEVHKNVFTFKITNIAYTYICLIIFPLTLVHEITFHHNTLSVQCVCFGSI